jgi:AcrR family transcriptional regulator
VARLTRQEKQAETRRHLVEAATRVFARRGYKAASIEEIAEEAGFSHGAVYSNFAGKEALFLAVYEERIARRQTQISAAHDAGDTPVERARSASGQWMRQVRDDPEYFLLFLEFVLHAARDEGVAATFGAQTRTTRDTIAQLLGDRGTDGLDADRLALAIRALGLGLAIEHVLNPGDVPDDLYADVVEILVTRSAPGGRAARGR